MKCKVINLEAGMPRVDIGIRKLYLEITTAKHQRIKILKVIHGYGSSGVGGSLKKGVSDYLSQKKKEGFVKDYITGENWNIFNESTRNVLSDYKDLKKDRDLGNRNPGITMIFL